MAMQADRCFNRSDYLLVGRKYSEYIVHVATEEKPIPQHTYNVRLLKPQSTIRHVAPLGDTLSSLRANPSLLLFLHAVCLVETLQIPIFTQRPHVGFLYIE